MKNASIVIGIILLTGAVIWLWTERAELKEEVDSLRASGELRVSETPPAGAEPLDAVEMMMSGSGSRRTWVIYATDQPDNEHIEFGDAFRIRKNGSERKLVPLSHMRTRWGKPAGFEVDMVKSDHPLLCGKITLDSHATEKDHLIVIESNGPDGLDIDYDVWDDSQTLEDQCKPLGNTHGGRAHAEN